MYQEYDPDFNPVSIGLNYLGPLPCKQTLEEVLRFCSTCNKFPPPGSYVCKRGHATCFDCLKPEKVCEFLYKNKNGSVAEGVPCGEDLLGNQPCYTHKKFLSFAKFKCPNAKSCQETIAGHQLLNHGLVCIQTKNLKCWLDKAHLYEEEILFSVSTFLGHLTQYHNVRMYENCNGLVAEKLDDWKLRGFKMIVPFILKHEENFHFICFVKHVMLNTGSALILVLYSSNPSIPIYQQQKEFSATIEFIQADRDRHKQKPLIWHGKLPDVHKPLRDVVKANSCLILLFGDTSPPSGYIRVRVDV